MRVRSQSAKGAAVYKQLLPDMQIRTLAPSQASALSGLPAAAIHHLQLLEQFGYCVKLLERAPSVQDRKQIQAHKRLEATALRLSQGRRLRRNNPLGPRRSGGWLLGEANDDTGPPDSRAAPQASGSQVSFCGFRVQVL